MAGLLLASSITKCDRLEKWRPLRSSKYGEACSTVARAVNTSAAARRLNAARFRAGATRATRPASSDGLDHEHREVHLRIVVPVRGFKSRFMLRRGGIRD